MVKASSDSVWRRLWKPRSLNGRVLGAMLLIGLLPLLVLGSYGFLMERRRAVDHELAKLSAQSQRLAISIDRRLTLNLSLARHLAISAKVVSFLGGRGVPFAPVRGHAGSGELGSMNAWLRGHAELAEDVDAILLMRPDGLCVASSQPLFIGGNYAFRSYFQDAMQGRYRLTDWQLGLKDGAPCVFISQVVKGKGRILGVLVIRLGTSWIQKEVAAQGDRNRVAFLINPDGIFLAHSQAQAIYTALRPIPPRRLEELRETQQFLGREHPVLIRIPEDSTQVMFRALATGQPVEERYFSGDIARWVALRRLDEEPWLVGIAANEYMIFSHSRNILLWSVLVAAVMIGLVVLGGLWFSHRILRPLLQLDQVIHDLASGKADARAPEEGDDELGRLGRHFNEMAATIHGQTQALAERVDTLEGILPICASCHKIRNEEGVYEPVEAYISTRSAATFTHGICEDCARKLYPELYGPDGRRKSASRDSRETS